jgi:hypothetical protein
MAGAVAVATSLRLIATGLRFAAGGARPRGGRRGGRQPPILAQQHDADDEPGEDDDNVGPAEPGHAEGQPVDADEDDPRRDDVPRADEEGVDRLLGLVLLLAGGGKPEHLLGGVHDRVVGGVLGRLGPPQEREADARPHQAVGAQRHDREGEERPRHAEILDEAGHQEGLNDDRGDVHPEKEPAVEPADVGPHVESGIGRRQRGCVLQDGLAQEILAGRVDDVQQHEKGGDEHEVAAAEDETESAAWLQALS